MNCVRSLLPLLVLASLAAGGCGDEPEGRASTPQVTTPQDPPTAAVEEFAGEAGAARFTTVAESICQASLEGVRPVPAAGASTRQLRRYARSADSALQRLDAAIGVLVQQRPQSAPQLGPLRQAVQGAQLEAAAVRSGQAEDPERLLATIQSLASVAQEVRLPACALR